MSARAVPSAVFPLLAITWFGCGGGPAAIPDELDIGGTYSLIERTEAGTTWTGPLATGTLVLEVASSSPAATRGRYDVDMMLPTGRVVDAGTFSFSGADWSQRSTSTRLEARGTIHIDGLELVLDITSPPGHAARSVWFLGPVATAG